MLEVFRNRVRGGPGGCRNWSSRARFSNNFKVSIFAHTSNVVLQQMKSLACCLNIFYKCVYRYILQCMTQCRVNSQVYLAFTFAFNVVATRSQLDCSTTFLHWGGWVKDILLSQSSLTTNQPLQEFMKLSFVIILHTPSCCRLSGLTLYFVLQ